MPQDVLQNKAVAAVNPSLTAEQTVQDNSISALQADKIIQDAKIALSATKEELAQAIADGATDVEVEAIRAQLVADQEAVDAAQDMALAAETLRAQTEEAKKSLKPRIFESYTLANVATIKPGERVIVGTPTSNFAGEWLHIGPTELVFNATNVNFLQLHVSNVGSINPDDISIWDAAETDIDQGAVRKFFNGGETLIFGRLVDDATADGGAGPDAAKWQDITALDPNVLNYIDSDAAGGTAFGLFGTPARYEVTGATPVSIAFPSDGGLNGNLWAMVFNKGASTVTIEGKVINAGEGAIITADGGVDGPLVTLMGGSPVLPDGATETIHTFSTNNNVFSATFGGWQFKGNSTSRQIRVRNVSGKGRMAVNADAWRESAPKGNALTGSGVTSRVFGHNVENTLSARDFTFDNGGGSSDGDVEYAAVTVYEFDSSDRLKFGKVQEMEVSMAVGHSWNGNDWRVVIREY